jgi:hypothetical protein
VTLVLLLLLQESPAAEEPEELGILNGVGVVMDLWIYQSTSHCRLLNI